MLIFILVKPGCATTYYNSLNAGKFHAMKQRSKASKESELRQGTRQPLLLCPFAALRETLYPDPYFIPGSSLRLRAFTRVFFRALRHLVGSIEFVFDSLALDVFYFIFAIL